ncbi:OB-fold nucleic acid binding domain-containing protein, partial [Bifidobacterium bifidum]
LEPRTVVTIAGLITSVERKISKKGNAWAIITVEDMEASVQCLFFGKAYEENASKLNIDTIVRVRGFAEAREEAVSIRAQEL